MESREWKVEGRMEAAEDRISVLADSRLDGITNTMDELAVS